MPRCFLGWWLTLQSLILLSDDNKELLFQFLLTFHLNQDCLENLFSRIWGTGGNRTNPTAYELQTCFKVVCVNTWTQTHRLSNCEKIDNDQFIIDMLQCPDENKLKNFDNENESNYEDESDKLLEQLCTESIEISTWALKI